MNIININIGVNQKKKKNLNYIHYPSLIKGIQYAKKQKLLRKKIKRLKRKKEEKEEKIIKKLRQNNGIYNSLFNNNKIEGIIKIVPIDSKKNSLIQIRKKSAETDENSTKQYQSKYSLNNPPLSLNYSEYCFSPLDLNFSNLPNINSTHEETLFQINNQNLDNNQYFDFLN